MAQRQPFICTFTIEFVEVSKYIHSLTDDASMSHWMLGFFPTLPMCLLAVLFGQQSSHASHALIESLFRA